MADQTFEVYTSSATGTQIDNAAAKVAAMEETLSGTAGVIPSSKAVKDAIDAATLETDSTLSESTTKVPTSKAVSDAIKDTLSKEAIVLPSSISLFTNKDYSIYKTNILKGTDNRTDVELFASGIKNYDRQFVANITDDKSVPILGYAHGSKTTLKNVDLKAVDSAAMSGKTVRVLCIGDSFTDIGQWVNEIYQQLDAAGANVEMIGTTLQSKGQSWLCEGLSGATLDWVTQNNYVGYILNVTSADGIPQTTYTSQFVQIDGKNWTVRGTKLTEDNGVYSGKILLGKWGVAEQELPASGTATIRGINVTWDSVERTSWNPFWNRTENKVDFNWYLNKYGFNTPDIICIQFGLNDLANATDASLTNMMTRLASLITTIHTQLPSTGIVISIPPFDGIHLSGSTSGNKNRLDMKYILHKYMKALCNTYDNSTYSGYVTIAPSYAFVDRENGYTKQEVALNTRFPSVKDVVYTDPLHCNEQGMRQIGDCVVPALCSLYAKVNAVREYGIEAFDSGYIVKEQKKSAVSNTANITYYGSDFIDIDGATSIEVVAQCDSSYCTPVAFFSERSAASYISSIPTQDTWNTVNQPRLLTIPGAAGDLYEGETLTIPAGAKYIRVSSVAQYNSVLSPSVTVRF